MLELIDHQDTTPPAVSYIIPPNAATRAVTKTAATGVSGDPLHLLAVTTPATVTPPVTASPAPVALGTASTFAVMAGSTVTNTGATIVNGDLGLSPGTAVTGFPPGIVNGGMYTSVASAAAQARVHLTTAYNDAAGRTLAPVTLAGNIGANPHPWPLQVHVFA